MDRVEMRSALTPTLTLPLSVSALALFDIGAQRSYICLITAYRSIRIPALPFLIFGIDIEKFIESRKNERPALRSIFLPTLSAQVALPPWPWYVVMKRNYIHLLRRR